MPATRMGASFSRNSTRPRIMMATMLIGPAAPVRQRHQRQKCQPDQKLRHIAGNAHPQPGLAGMKRHAPVPLRCPGSLAAALKASCPRCPPAQYPSVTTRARDHYPFAPLAGAAELAMRAMNSLSLAITAALAVDGGDHG